MIRVRSPRTTVESSSSKSWTECIVHSLNPEPFPGVVRLSSRKPGTWAPTKRWSVCGGACRDAMGVRRGTIGIRVLSSRGRSVRFGRRRRQIPFVPQGVSPCASVSGYWRSSLVHHETPCYIRHVACVRRAAGRFRRFCRVRRLSGRSFFGGLLTTARSWPILS